MTLRQGSTSYSLAWVTVALALCATIPHVRAATPSASWRTSDARLQQKVSARAADLPLRALLGELSRQTGVRLRTAPDYEDRAITARVGEMPLLNLMDRVAALYGDTWRPSGKKEAPSYVLEAAVARRQKQRRFLEAYQGALHAELVNHARTVAEKGPAPWQVEGVRAEPPEAAARYAAELKARASLIAALEPQAVRHLLDGGRIRVQATQATGRLGEALRSFLETFAMPLSTGWSREQHATAWVEFASEPYMLRAHAPGLPLRRLDFVVGGPGGRSSGYGLVVHPEGFAARLDEQLAALRRDEEQEPGQRRRQGGAALARVLPETMKPKPGTPAVRSEVLLAIADAADLDLISDSHTKHPLAVPAMAGRSVEEALSAVCRLYACSWRAEQEAILVRSQYWWLDDLLEPPATALARWQSLLEQRGVLDLDEAAGIGALSVERQQRLALRIPEARSAFGPWMRLYAILNARQRQAVKSTAGLPMSQIAEPQRLQITTVDAVNNPYLGSAGIEKTLADARATFKIREEVMEESRPTVIFQLDPVPDQQGRNSGHAVRSTVRLPYRTRAKAQPAPSRP